MTADEADAFETDVKALAANPALQAAEPYELKRTLRNVINGFAHEMTWSENVEAVAALEELVLRAEEMEVLRSELNVASRMR